jgi:hypothetical protein
MRDDEERRARKKRRKKERKKKEGERPTVGVPPCGHWTIADPAKLIVSDGDIPRIPADEDSVPVDACKR